MPKFPRPTGKELLSFLLRKGFLVVRVRGSHHVLAKGTLRTVLPVHGNDQLRIGTLRGILRDAHVSAEEFLNEWDA